MNKLIESLKRENEIINRSKNWRDATLKSVLMRAIKNKSTHGRQLWAMYECQVFGLYLKAVTYKIAVGK